MIVIHSKKSVVSVWCGQNIFGKVTDAEGDKNGHYKVTCESCIEKILEAAARPRYGWVNGAYVQVSKLENTWNWED